MNTVAVSPSQRHCDSDSELCHSDSDSELCHSDIDGELCHSASDSNMIVLGDSGGLALLNRLSTHVRTFDSLLIIE